MKIDRLLALTIYLLNHGKTSAQQLAQEFEVSTRTIMRDMDTLSKAGIPIQSSFGIEGGYEIMDTFIMEKQLAYQEDYDFIVTALNGLASAYTNKSMKQTLRKMEVLADKKQNPISVDFSVAKENDILNAQIQLLETAVKEERRVQFQYTNSRDQVKQVIVEPVSVIYKWYAWYLVGYYEKYNDYCMFKLVRIENLIMTQEKNSRKHKPEEIRLNHDESQNMIEIKIYGKSKVRVRCREYLDGKITKEYENGDFEFCFTVWENENHWYGVLLSLGSDIRIIEPQSVIDRILKTCNDLIKEYEGEKMNSQMSNVYENCPVLENDYFCLRLIEKKDATDLLETYSDKNALPFFNSDNCNGDNFYCETIENMSEAIKYWLLEYERKGFVRFSIIDKSSHRVIGTIELFNRKAEDAFNNCGLLRLDIRSDYEDKEIIYQILSAIVNDTYDLFDCTMIATKAPVYAVERIQALKRLGFKKSEQYLVGHQDHRRYYDYWVITR